ncbi:armadillo-type protein [Fomitopsis serialis]|uniref:armadillo-type protein n=1 Tax=Fomitopsis serialis TaxID=139415 RepID=UPI002008461E|nr:armadillo-type protein [Neoantrodia serialis]KAH9938689.1 armadillo-type protein [Neoantrodia serialis]
MSYHHGGGHRRKQHRGADDYDSHGRRETFDTPEQKLRKSIINLGEVDPVQELPRLASDIRAANDAATAAGGPAIPAISEGFRIGVTEQPFKIPYYAALLRLLHDQPEDAEENPPAEASPPLGKQSWRILEGFQAFLDKLAWREIRLCSLKSRRFNSSRTAQWQASFHHNMFELLRSFTAVLQEFGVSHGRAMKAALCAAEGLMIAGPIVSKSGADATEIIAAIRDYSDSVTGSKTLVQPIVRLHEQSPIVEHTDELLDSALAALSALREGNFAETANSFVQPYVDFPEFTPAPFELPSVLVAPEVIELDGLTTEAGEDAQVKKEEWPAYFVRLFDNDVTPDPTTPSGYAIRAAILDILDVFEVNRKECARLLLEYPKWTLHGTFKPRPGAPEQEPVTEKNWQLENTIIEITLGSVFLLPESTYKPVYYIALITEISIRKLYTLLSDGLDVEVAHRFADWFSVHMSNFGSLGWKEWVPDIALSLRHPKRRFVRKALEYEIRLSDAKPGNPCMPEESPGPDYDYDDPSKPYHDAAQSLLTLLRGRTKAEDVVSHLDPLKNSISETAEGDVNVSSVVRSIAVQSLLHIGNRSFSHFLNAIERYLPLLRNIASGGGAGATGSSNTEARMDILSAVANYWKRVRNMIVIYQIVDPTDVVTWTFAYGGALTGAVGKSSFDAFQWGVLKARAIATEGGDMEVDAEAKPDVLHVAESPAQTTALKAFATLTREQKAALSRTLDGFVGYLVAGDHANPTAAEVITEKSWHNRVNWNEVQWETWETWCWFRHFCRAYSPYLRNYTQSLEEASMTKVGPSDPAVDLFKKTWNIATGQEV